MGIRPDVSYIPYATYSKKKTGNIIMFAQFQEGNLLSETRNNTEISNEYYDNSTLPPLISEEEMDTMSSCNEYDAKPMSTDMLEYICNRSQYHPSINSIRARYKIRDHFKQRQVEWKGVLLST